MAICFIAQLSFGQNKEMLINLDSLREMATIKETTESFLKYKAILLAVRNSQIPQDSIAIANLQASQQETQAALEVESTRAEGWQKQYQQERQKRTGFLATLKRLGEILAAGFVGYSIGVASQ